MHKRTAVKIAGAVLAGITSLGLAAPSQAASPTPGTLTPTSYGHAAVGEPKWQVEHNFGTRGTRLIRYDNGLGIVIVKAYPGDTADQGALVTYSRPHGDRYFRLITKQWCVRTDTSFTCQA